MIFLLLTISAVICILLVEWLMVSKYVKSFKIRVHVNGTRGKSTVTNYIAVGLSGPGQNIMSKVTGEQPLICYNGQKTEIKRKGKARVQEQFSVMRKAYSSGIESLIMECMSITPELQILESRIFKPHIYVITNIKDDHREAMGQNQHDQVKSICRAIPWNCTVITSESRHLEAIQKESEKKGSKVVSPDTLSNEIIKNLPAGCMVENISLALEACSILGADPEQVIKRIIESHNQEESLLLRIESDEKKIFFLNAFSANDLESTSMVIDYWERKGYKKSKISVIFNTRADRPLRTVQFCEWITDRRNSIDKLIITGSHIPLAKRKLIKSGIESKNIHTWRGDKLSKENIFKTVEAESMIVGIGNFGGDGQKIMERLK